MQRRTLLKRSGALVALSVPLAGCSDSGSNNSTDGGDGGGDGDGGSTATPGATATGTPGATATETPSATATPGSASDVTGNATSAVSELDVVDWTERPDLFEDFFAIEVTVENTGDQTTDLFEYNYSMTVFDEEGNELSGSSGTSAGEGSEIAPGEQGPITVYSNADGDLSAIARFEITLQCEGTFRAEGTYC